MYIATFAVFTSNLAPPTPNFHFIQNIATPGTPWKDHLTKVRAQQRYLRTLPPNSTVLLLDSDISTRHNLTYGAVRSAAKSLLFSQTAADTIFFGAEFGRYDVRLRLPTRYS